MPTKIDLKSIVTESLDRLIKSIPKIILYAFLFLFILTFLGLKTVNASILKNDQLMVRISQDYSNKFCNSIAFGLSRESAMSFANKENKLIFKNKKGIESLSKELIANKIAISVVDRCGYIVDLKGEEGITQFENDYLEKNNDFMSDN
tara:strand:- start:117 stop:560 length:444 start_codon:yes stop_codon:yes gene_type:complete